MLKSSHDPRNLRLLPLDQLRKTGPVDEASWNYHPLLRYVSRLRFALATSLLQSESARLLEIGYGSGVFSLELARHTHALFGIDLHAFNDVVAATLERQGVVASLTVGSIERTSFPDHFFDEAVAISSLEFVGNLDVACTELRRILTSNGSLVVVTPQSSPILDSLLLTATGECARQNYGDRRERLFPTLERYFTLERFTVSPNWTPISMYRAARLRPRP